MDKLSGHFKIGLRMPATRPALNAGRLLTVTIVVTAVSAVFAIAASIGAGAGLASLLPEIRGQGRVFALACGCILITVGAVAAVAAARAVISIEPLRAVRTEH